MLNLKERYKRVLHFQFVKSCSAIHLFIHEPFLEFLQEILRLIRKDKRKNGVYFHEVLGNDWKHVSLTIFKTYRKSVKFL